MTYIDYINQFNRWKENSSPSDKAIILYFAFLEVFNQRRWPSMAVIDTPRLMSMARTSNRNTALRARDELCSAGLIAYKAGHKGMASEYILLPIRKGTEYGINSDTESCTESGKSTEKGSGKSINFDTVSCTQSDTPIKSVDKEEEKDDDDIVVVSNAELAIQEYQKRISRTMTAGSVEGLRYYAEQMELGCIIMAFDKAVDQGHRNWSYVNGVLKNKLEQGVHTVKDWERVEKRRTQKDQGDGLPFLK